MVTVEINGQHGEPSSRHSVWPLQKKISDELSVYVAGGYFKSISKVAIVFRVSGRIWSFAPEGAGSPSYKKIARTISIDFVISERQWKGVSSEGISKVVAEGVRNCFGMIVVKAKNVGELGNEERLLADVEEAISAFLSTSDS